MHSPNKMWKGEERKGGSLFSSAPEDSLVIYIKNMYVKSNQNQIHKLDKLNFRNWQFLFLF